MLQNSQNMQSNGLVSISKYLARMWDTLQSAVTGTKSTKQENELEDKRERYFKRICEYELEILQINTQISELEERRVFLEDRLDNAVVIYSKLNTKG